MSVEIQVNSSSRSAWAENPLILTTDGFFEWENADEEEFEGLRRPDLSVSGWNTLTIAQHGSPRQVERFVRPSLEGEIEFSMADIDRLSRKVPNLCKVSPSVPDYHMEDVHRAGGIMGILGELDRGGLIDHLQVLPDTSREPDYEAVMAALQKLSG